MIESWQLHLFIIFITFLVVEGLHILIPTIDYFKEVLKAKVRKMRESNKD